MSAPATNSCPTLELRIQAGQSWLDARLVTPADCHALLVFVTFFAPKLGETRDAHFLPRFHESGFASLQVCLVSAAEHDRDPDLRYDIARLDQRVGMILDWTAQQPGIGTLRRGLHATDTLAAAAIRVLARDASAAAALVCRAGRPELAGGVPLRGLEVPTLLQIAGAEPERLAPSEQAYALLHCVRDWQVFEGASQSFIEPGTADAASRHAQQWFERHLRPGEPGA